MAEWKQKKVAYLSEEIKKSKIVGILTVRGLPSKQLQAIKTKLPATIVMGKKNLMLRALEGSKKKGIKDLEQYITDQPAFILSDENPFKLCSIINKSRSPAPAKAGDIAPSDIVIDAGGTPFQPGPVLGELKGVGIPCSIDGGKIVITETKSILSAGEEISAKLAEMLGRLGIEPMEVGLNLLACYENGSVFPADVLSIDEDEYFGNFVKAYKNSLNLSVEAAFPTTVNIEIMIQKCYSNSKGLSIEAGILNAATLGEILGRAARAANSLSSLVKAEAPKEEKAVEQAEPEKETAEAEPKSEAEAPVKPEEQKTEEVKPEEQKTEEPKAEETKPEEPKAEEQKTEEVKPEEPKQETKKQEAKED